MKYKVLNENGLMLPYRFLRTGVIFDDVEVALSQNSIEELLKIGAISEEKEKSSTQSRTSSKQEAIKGE